MISNTTSRDIVDLDARFQPMVRELLVRSAHLDSFITDGARTWARQAWLYATGKTRARPGWSYHNYGLAVDIAFKPGGKLSYDAWRYEELFRISRAVSIESLYLVAGFDKPHFQYPNLTIDIIRRHQGLPLVERTMTEEQVKRVWTAVVHALPIQREIEQWRGRDANELITHLLEDAKWKKQNWLVHALRDEMGAEKL